jgi:NitT/TauT family transport system permease protein
MTKTSTAPSPGTGPALPPDRPTRSPVRQTAQAKRTRRATVIFCTQLLVGMLFLTVWQLVVDLGLIPVNFISTPVLVWKALTQYIASGELLVDSATTVTETMLGFVVGGVAGVVAGLFLGRFRFVSAVLTPFLTALNAMPRVALAPMFILWFGIGMESKVYLAVSVVFFIVLIATESGVRTVDPDFTTMGRAIGATERHAFMTIVLPASVPSVFAGLKLGAVYALLATIFGEMLSAQQGWGQKISLYSQSFRPEGVFAVLIVVVVFAVALNGIMAAAEKHLLRWQQ